MESRQLHYFRIVVDQGSFTRAAEVLDMTQPSLSLSIRKLEKQAEVQLLIRGWGGIVPTEAGRYLYRVASQVDSLLGEADRRIREIAGGLAGQVSISTNPEFNWDLMPRVISRLRSEAPGVELFLRDPEPLQTLENVLDGQADLGLMPSTDPQAFARQYSDSLTVLAAASFRLAVALPERLSHLPNPVPLQDLAGETWVLSRRRPEYIGMPELLDAVWAEHPTVRPVRVQEIATMQTALPLVGGGVGVTLIAENASTFANHRIHYRRTVEEIPPIHAVLIHRRDRELSPAAERLRDLILEVGRGHDAGDGRPPGEGIPHQMG